MVTNPVLGCLLLTRSHAWPGDSCGSTDISDTLAMQAKFQDLFDRSHWYPPIGNVASFGAIDMEHSYTRNPTASSHWTEHLCINLRTHLGDGKPQTTLLKKAELFGFNGQFYLTSGPTQGWWAM